MLNKLGSNQLLVIALLCAPLLLLQGLWLAFTSTLLTLLIILATSLLGFGLLSMLTLRLQQVERSHQEQVWCRALQLRDPTCLTTPRPRPPCSSCSPTSTRPSATPTARSASCTIRQPRTN